MKELSEFLQKLGSRLTDEEKEKIISIFKKAIANAKSDGKADGQNSAVIASLNRSGNW